MVGRRYGSVGARRLAALTVLVAWGLVGLARTSLLVAPAATPVGADLEPFLGFAREVIPNGAAYLYVEPLRAAPGADDGTVPRLRYELYPRQFENALPGESEQAVRERLAREGRRYVVVPDARLLPEDHWLRQAPAPGGFRRLELDQDRFILLVEQP